MCLLISEHILRGIYIIQLLPIFKLEIILQNCKGPHAIIKNVRILKMSDAFSKMLKCFRINIIILCHMAKNEPENNTDVK